jgi:hypothetical protein
MERDLHSHIDDRVALDPQAIATDTTTAGNIIDTEGFESLEFLLWTKTVTDGDYAWKIEHGDDAALADAADAASDDVLGSLAGFTADTDDNSVNRVGYIGKKRYVRASIVSTNTTTGVDAIGILAILSHPRRAPVAQ